MLALLLHHTISPDWVEEEKEKESEHEMDTENQHDDGPLPHNNENKLADEPTIDNITETHDSKPSLMDVNSWSVITECSSVADSHFPREKTCSKF